MPRVYCRHQTMTLPHNEYIYTFDGVRIRYATWRTDSTDGKGSVVVLGGRTEFVEKYHEAIEDLSGRGFDVYSMDWRGQGLSDRLLKDATKGYVDTYEHYYRDLELFLNNIVLTECRRPLIIMAHSMGANIVLHCLDRFNGAVDKAVLLAPMVDVVTSPVPYTFAKWCSRFFVKIGMGDFKIPSLKHKDNYRRPFHRNRMTHDRIRFERIRTVLNENSLLAVTSVTYGWLAATFNAIERIQEPGFLTDLETPLLMVAAGRDQVVCNLAIGNMASRLPSCELVTINGANHEILQECDGLRDQFWKAFDRFLCL